MEEVRHGVLYFIAGKRHWPVLVVSLMSLRDHWTGPVGIMLGDDNARELFGLLDKGGGLGPLIPIPFKTKSYGRNSGYMNKIKMIEMSPFDSTVFLDADTAVVKTLDPLFITPSGRVRLTRYSNWITTGGRIRGRIRAWSEVAPELAKEQTSKSYPAINTGVVAFGNGERSMEFARDWTETAELRGGSFLADEIAAQLIWLRQGAEVVDDRWNCSPIHGTNRDGAHVWHFHGRKHLRERAQRIWWPLYERAVRDNVGGIRDWTPAGDNRLRQFLKQKGRA